MSLNILSLEVLTKRLVTSQVSRNLKGGQVEKI